MKFSLFVTALCLGSVSAFAPQATTSTRVASATERQMFGGAGEGMPNADDPEEEKKIEEAAKAMGMSAAEYKLGISARVRLTNQLNAARISAGNGDTVKVERDGNNPPKMLDITVTEAGKALGQEGLSKELCAALKQASEDSRKTRAEAQKEMMAFIQDEMKSIG